MLKYDRSHGESDQRARTNRWRLRTAILVFFVLSFGWARIDRCALAQTNADISKILRAWEEYANIRFGHVVRHWRVFDPSKNEIQLEQRVELIQSDAGWLSSTEQKVGPAASSGFHITAANPRYGFEIVRPLATDSWAIILQDVGDGRIEQFADTQGSDIDWLISLDSSASLADLAKLSHFQMSVQSLTEDDAVVSIVLERTAELNRTSRPIFGGVLTLDPRHYFVIKHATVDAGEGEVELKMTIDNEYRVDGGTPLAAAQRIAVNLPGGSTRKIERVFAKFDREWGGDDAVFYLSHYGLPEPPEVKASGSYRTSMWHYYFIGGVLLVAVGAFTVHRASKWRA